MKRIEFIAPVEAVRGNLSGTQDLRYALNNNKAYEAPAGQRNYARNYRASFIGAKRASDGLKYFSVRTKSCTNVTAKWLKAGAILGGAGAIFADIMRNKTGELYNDLYAQWLELNSLGNKKSFRKSVMDTIMSGLRNKVAEIVYAGPRGGVTIDNPWVKVVVSPQTFNVYVTPAVLFKFWPQLATGTQKKFEININGKVGLAYFAEGQTWTERSAQMANVVMAEDGSYTQLQIAGTGENARAGVRGFGSDLTVYKLIDTESELGFDPSAEIDVEGMTLGVTTQVPPLE